MIWNSSFTDSQQIGSFIVKSQTVPLRVLVDLQFMHRGTIDILQNPL